MAYKEKHAIRCPWDVEAINSLAEDLPARKTKDKTCGRRGFQGGDSLKDWLGNMLMNNFFQCNGNMQSGASAGSNHGGIALTMLGGEVRKRKAALALQDADSNETEKPKQDVQKPDEAEPKKEMSKQKLFLRKISTAWQ